MAITVDTTSHATAAGGAMSWNQTINNSKELLVLFVVYGSTFGNQHPTAKYNGVSMSRTNSFALTSIYLGSVFVLANPDTGNNAFIVENDGSATVYFAAAVAFNGAAQTGQPADYQEGFGSPTATATLTTQVGDYIFGIGMIDGTHTMTTTPGITGTTPFYTDNTTLPNPPYSPATDIYFTAGYLGPESGGSQSFAVTTSSTTGTISDQGAFAVVIRAFPANGGAFILNILAG